MAGSLVERMIGAAFLNVDTYEEVEHDRSATRQAAVVVAMVAVAQAIGSSALGFMGAGRAAVMALVGWAVWAGIAYLVGDKILGGTASWGELLRTLGFAQAPGVLMVLGLIPLLGTPILFVVSIWMLGAAFIGMRQALDFGNGKTMATVLIGWGAYVTLMAVF
ncbi:MAG TPA: YIP1 family protein [Longimicrobiales bacterium]|nr:YIP1 family protein [Longimicrobiales bacterium]